MSGRRNSYWVPGSTFQVPWDQEIVDSERVNWHLEHGTWNYNVVVIGGGIIGASAAIEIATAHPDWRIIIIEKTNGPHGASTRNAGFACFGSLSEIAADIDLLGADATRELVRQRYEGLQILRKRCGDEHINYEASGGHEVFLEHHPALDRIDEINTLLETVFNAPTFTRNDDLISSFKLKALSLVHTKFEGMLDSGMLVQRLWHLAQQLGVHIIQNDAKEITRNSDNTYTIHREFENSIHARRVILAANARNNDFLRSLPVSPSISKYLRLTPARGQILVTSPISDLSLSGTYHYNQGYVYFRNVGNRVLLGGGRDIVFEEEETLSMDTTPRIQGYLENYLHDVILPGRNVQIEYRWAGTMAFSETKQPIVEEVLPNLYVAFGCNGMGVAIGSAVAKQVSLLTS